MVEGMDEDNQLVRGKPEVLAGIVFNVSAAVSRAGEGEIYEAVRAVMKEWWYGPWDRYGALGRPAARWENAISQGLIGAGWLGERSYEELVAAFTVAMDYPEENATLGILLAVEAKRRSAALADLVRAGEILSDLLEIDPYLSVVGPGIESYFSRFCAGGYPANSEDSVAAGLYKVLTIALGEAKAGPEGPALVGGI